MGLWPQFRSPLVWDVFAVSTYATVSLLFWYVGLIPDLATLRDRAEEPLRPDRLRHSGRWAGAARRGTGTATRRPTCCWPAWRRRWSSRCTRSCRFDFAVGIVPGWHATIFPPYFVAGAIYSGFAMVLTLAIPLRAAFGLQDFITMRHLENMAKVMLATGLIVVYGYMIEVFIAWYSGNHVRAVHAPGTASLGPYASLLVADLLQRRDAAAPLVPAASAPSPFWLFIVSLIVNVGMWLERFVIVVTSLHRDFLPSSWGMYTGTIWDWATFIGTLGLFLDAALPVHPLPAGDLDLRDAHDRARDDRRAVARQ